MPKSLYVDPVVTRAPGKIEFKDIPVNRAKKREQLAASYEMMQSTRSATTFADALTLGLPIMVAMLFQLMPKGIAPAVIQPLVGNGFAVGVIMVMIMEHVINRPKS